MYTNEVRLGFTTVGPATYLNPSRKELVKLKNLPVMPKRCDFCMIHECGTDTKAFLTSTVMIVLIVEWLGLMLRIMPADRTATLFWVLRPGRNTVWAGWKALIESSHPSLASTMRYIILQVGL